MNTNDHSPENRSGNQTKLTTGATDGTQDDRGVDGLVDKEHKQNDNWEWSDAVTQYINDRIEGLSLMVCPGLRPIADANLDIERLESIGQSENADFSVTHLGGGDERLKTLRERHKDTTEGDGIYGRLIADDGAESALYDGYAVHGTMYSLPWEDNTFTTTISDPPWLELSAGERRTLFDELVRVTKPTGTIIYNATWIPEHDYTRQYEVRFRQELDFWGGQSFIASYRRSARHMEELFNAHNYESQERYPSESPFWSEAYSPEALSLDANTDPRLVSSQYAHYCCPMCACSQLGHLRGDEFFEDEGSYSVYQCHNCEYRVERDVVLQLGAAIEAKAESEGIAPNEVESIDFTPEEVYAKLDSPRPNHRTDLLQEDFPWVPEEAS